jgi:hypothetical protein
MAKKTKIEKETRRLIESISELIKRKGNRYKFKVKKKKQVRAIKRTCVHWIMRKGRPYPALVQSDEHPGKWKCSICGAVFPIKPAREKKKDSDGNILKDSQGNPITINHYEDVANEFLSHINQLQFWSVMMGGDSEDTKMFVQLRKLIPRYMKVQNNISKAMDRKNELENRKRDSETNSAFNNFSNFSYSV